MYKLKLIKGGSYTGAVRATKAKPYVEVESQEEAEYLISTGYFELCKDEDAGDSGDDSATAPDYDALSKMTKAELTAYAALNKISLAGCKSKADILTAISVCYGGNRTMIELQQQ